MPLPAPAGAAANNAKLVVTLILYLPPAPQQAAQGAGTSAWAEPAKEFVSGNLPGLQCFRHRLENMKSLIGPASTL
jgi:hypothetical protein